MAARIPACNPLISVISRTTGRVRRVGKVLALRNDGLAAAVLTMLLGEVLWLM